MELFLSRYWVTSVIRIDELARPLQLVIASCGENHLSLWVTSTLYWPFLEEAAYTVNLLHLSSCCGLNLEIITFASYCWPPFPGWVFSPILNISILLLHLLVDLHLFVTVPSHPIAYDTIGDHTWSIDTCKGLVKIKMWKKNLITSAICKIKSILYRLCHWK